MKRWIWGVVFMATTLPAFAQESQNFDTDSTGYAQIDEVVVTGVRDRIDIRHLPMSVSVVNKELIENRYEPSLLPILTEQVPGLFTTARGIMGFGVSTGGSGGIKMRGIGGEPTTGMLVLIDGHPQYMGLMGHPIADAYQSMMTERVEVVRTPASVIYGSNAMGGVINILTNQNKQDGLHNGLRLGYGSYNTLNSELSSRYREGKFSVQVVGSYNRTDGHRPDMEFEQYGGYAKVGYDISSNWNLFADLNLTHYNASNPGMDSNPIIDNDSRITRGVASLSLENNYGATSGALKLFYNWGHHNINDGYFEGGTPKDYLFDSRDVMLGVNWYQTASLYSGNRVTLGVDYNYFGGVANSLFNDGSVVEIADKKEDNVAAYFDYRQSFGDFLTLNAGVRADHHSVTGTHIIPQFGASIYPMASGELKLIASKGFRNPTIREMYMFPPQNPLLLPEELWSYELSWRQRLLENRLSYELTLFYINGDNMIQLLPFEGRMMYQNSGKVENKGVEFSTSYRISDMFSLSANYSYLDMKYKVVAAPEHKLYAGLNFTSGRWHASTGVQYIAGLYTSTAPDNTTQQDFTLWNARVNYQLSDVFALYARGENLLNQQYEINNGFPMPGATVMVGVDVKF